MREKTLLKANLEVDMNEFFQQKVDSELFEGLDEGEKAQFVGNFFHWVKCRFSDCNNLAQKEKSKNKKEEKPQSTAQTKIDNDPSPTAAASKAAEDAYDVTQWETGIGHGTPMPEQSKDKAPSDKPPYPKFVQVGDEKLVQTKAEINTKVDSEKHERITTNTAKAVQAQLAKEEHDDMVK